MEDSLVQALAQCMNPNLEVRQSAESYIESSKINPGFTVLLFQVSYNALYSEDIRLLSSIILKNQVSDWKNCKVPSEDKSLIKSNIISGLKWSVTEKIRSQYEEIAQTIGRHEYPWEGINDQIHSYLDSNDPDYTYAALVILNKLFKNYEFAISDKRDNLKVLAGHFFSKIEGLMQKLLLERGNERFYYINLILQIYWLCFYIELPSEQVSQGSLNSWFSNFSQVLSLEFDEGLPKDHNEEEIKSKDQKLQCKKWAAQIVYRLFSRYNDPKAQIDSNKTISEVFTTTWAIPFLELTLNQVFKYKTVFIPEVIMNYSLKYITQSIKFQPTHEKLKNISPPGSSSIFVYLISNIITPVLFKTSYDEELWADNPIEYIRKECDLSKIYYSSTSAAIDLLETLCKSEYLSEFLAYLDATLNSNPAPILKEALIYEVGSLSTVLLDHKNISNKVQDMLSIYVLPEIGSPLGFLRSRAAWAYGKFAAFPFTSPDHQVQALAGICSLLIDPETPVKYEAALSIPKIMIWEISKQKINSEISNLLKIYLNLINEIDSEEIIEALEHIVEHFSVEVVPFAVELVQQLSFNFEKLASREIADDNGDSAMVAVSVLNTIIRLIDTVADNSEETIKISMSLYPVLQHCLSKNGYEYMEEALKMLCVLLYNTSNGVLGHLYGLLRLVLLSLQPLDPYGTEKTGEIFPVVGNFISKYPELILKDLEDIIKLLVVLLQGDSRVQVFACKVFISLLEHLKLGLSNYIPQVLPLIYSKLTSGSDKLKAIAVQVIHTCIWADISTVHTLESLGILANTLNYTLSNPSNFKDKLSWTQVVLGLSTLLPLFDTSLKSDLNLTQAIINTIIEMIKLIEQDEDISDEDVDTNAPDFNEKCEELYKKIREKIEDSDESIGVLDTELEEYYDSVFETIDCKAYFKDMVSRLPSELVNALIGSLDFSNKAIANRIFNN
jgi:importin-7